MDRYGFVRDDDGQYVVARWDDFRCRNVLVTGETQRGKNVFLEHTLATMSSMMENEGRELVARRSFQRGEGSRVERMLIVYFAAKGAWRIPAESEIDHETGMLKDAEVYLWSSREPRRNVFGEMIVPQ